jgi:hypothetical protein
VLDRGVIVEQGPHEELLVRSGRYRALHDAQFGAASPREDGDVFASTSVVSEPESASQ